MRASGGKIPGKMVFFQSATVVQHSIAFVEELEV
jgi:hypothetical protein